ncbi:MAG TPA: DUF4252 domain-containing protein [Saprospiraceae bacterium]|nr:DUF4252 domain-containing protein [Saprospiraceae bacterium]
MRIITSFLLALFFTATASAQVDAIDKFFNQYQENKDFTVVYVSPKMFQMVSKATNEVEDKELKALIAGIKGLKILTNKVESAKYYAEAIKKLPVNEYETLITVRDKGQNVKFLTKGTGDIVNELLLLVGGGEDFVLMSFVGNLDLNNIAKLAKKINIDGAEHLEKIGKQ